MKKLFPPFLNIGSNGPAVVFLQRLLIAAGLNNENIVADGDYGEQTAEAVRMFQRSRGIDIDGNFGPETRSHWADIYGLDVNLIPLLKDEAETQVPEAEGTGGAGADESTETA